MKPELREAAERIVNGIRKTVKDNSTEYAVIGSGVFVMGLKEPYELAKLYLEEHPADDESPVDESWLRSVGFESDRTGCPTLRSLHIQSSRSAAYQPYACVRSLPIPVPKTRGEVRALCRLLGIPLTPVD